jgi:galactose mutarotase-like enzyme
MVYVTSNKMPCLTETVHIAAAELSATVTGGALLTVSSLRHRGAELLAGAEALPDHYRVHRRRAGITMLHPWANRLGSDSYSCAGAAARIDGTELGISRDPHGLAIHGLAIPGSWTVTEDGPASCFATASFGALAAFPFPHRVDVRLTLDSTTLIVLTTLWPLTAQPVPVAFGWHPYFVCDRRPGCTVAFPDRHRLELDARRLPTGSATSCPEERVPLAHAQFDDAFGELADGAAFELRDDRRTIRVTHDHGYPFAQVFAPPDAPVVSLEPMTAPADALRSGQQIRLAHPGRPYTAEFAVRAMA